ncbi:MAG: VWA domain-containing protein [Notoacmeibacter sp.]|nr:VWA domain-containing protein [Notoacmeibacter sp.]MCC0031929.1 VWA domain-containing protein [Brucellaceae bacterium]
MTVLHPLWLLAALACLAMALAARSSALRDGWGRVMNPQVLAWLRPKPATGAGLHPGWIAAAIGFAALSAPAIRADNQNAWRHAEAWLVMVDVSKSMGLDDIRPTRIAAARNAALALSKAAGARAAGLAVFSGDAYLAEPFSFDRRQYEAAAGVLETGLIPTEGSDVARALSLAASIVSDSGVSRARLFILSDAPVVTPAALATAAQFAARGHRIDVLAFAGETTETPAPQDMAANQRLAAAGNGSLVVTDGAGAIDIAALAAESGAAADPLATNPLEAEGWQGIAHWVLVAAIPFLLADMRRRLA